MCAIIINHDKKIAHNKLDDEVYNSLVEIEGNIMKLSPLAPPSLLREYKKIIPKITKVILLGWQNSGMSVMWNDNEKKWIPREIIE